MAGSDSTSVEESVTGISSSLIHRVAVAGLGVALGLLNVSAQAQGLYKYRGIDGEWIYSDRAPAEQQPVEIRDLQKGSGKPQVTVVDRHFGRQVGLIARNEFYSPVEVVVALDELRNVGLPPPDTSLRWVVPARSTAELLRLDEIEENKTSGITYRFVWVPGDPDSKHHPAQPYRAPFALSRAYRISQAFPVGITHTTADSRYAVDIAMPVGTDINAARSGIVVEVAGTNYRGGVDTTRDGAQANLVRILHDDGTFAIYAHLSLNSVRVRPGDKVVRGQYIAESGNTGFSSGPHLHFVIVRNSNLRMDSVPFVFEGQGGSEITPETGIELRAY